MSQLAYLESRRAALAETHKRAAWLVGTSPVAPIRVSANDTCARMELAMRAVDAAIVACRVRNHTATRNVR
jgi:hypothetical protein